MKSSADVRKIFLDFFQQQGHQIVASSPLVPANDPTLLFTNAGMVQFKELFLGEETRSYSRAVTSQRCVRAGGKHNDLENVGYTARHHTFFEMLGNFSFGDYFKREAIQYAWQFLTVTLGLPADKLWVTVFEDDDEAANIWINEMGVHPSRISRIGAKDNFWSMGDTGPCGPCSEIFYDHGPDVAGGPPGTPEEDGDRYIEIWNLVFMQYDRAADGTLTDLPKPSVDTGMGLERITAVMQGVNSNYETDLFKGLIEASEKILGNKGSVSHKVISDHIRSTSFLIVDGITPENEGRGYVLRRILRRAIRHGYKMGATKPFLNELVYNLSDLMKDAYPAIDEKKDHISSIIKNEEIKFFETLGKGINILDEAINNLKDKTIPGEVVFKLHDTFGFPFDLTADIAREKHLDIDEDAFNVCMDQQKKSSKAGSSFVSKLPAASGVDETIFLGYEDLKSESKVLVLWIDQERVDEANENQEIFIACNQTPFYAESGGQVGDKGRFSSSNSSGAILDCKKQGKVFIHKALVEKGSLKVGDVINMNVEKDKRLAIAIHHSSTHLLHSALRSILGEHVQQKGSLVDESKLRFDFSHGKPLSKEEIDSIEEIVNNEVLNNVDVSTKIMKLDDAMNSGAQALFGEKYDEEVRVLSMGSDSFSVELCGGTHVKRTGDIGVFVITAQSSVASGIRRIEAVAGKKALSYISEIRKVNNSLQEILNTPVDAMNEKIQSLIDENKKLKKSGGVTSSNADVVSSDVMDIDDWKLVVEHISIEDAKQLRGLVDQKKQSLDKGCVVLLNSHNNKVAIVSGVTDNLLDVISAKDVVSLLCEKLNGRGGGRPDFAQGAGESENINEFVTSIPALVKSLAK